MGSVNFISSLGNSAYAAAPKAAQATYDANAAEYGAVAASVMGAGSAVADAVGTAYTFSAESLEKLGEAAKSDFNALTGAVGEAVTDTGTAIGHVVDEARQGVSDLGTGLSNLVTEGVDALESAGDTIASKASSLADSVEQSVSSAASTVGDAVASVADSIGSAASGVAAYVTMGVAAGKQMLSEVA